MTATSHTLDFPATHDAVRQALWDLRKDVLGSGISPGLFDNAELVLAEVLNNIVEHAASGQNNGQIKVRAVGRTDALEFEVADNGAEMPRRKLPNGTLPNVEALPEGGFGWHLIRTMTCGLEYERNNGRNCLKFRVSAHP